MGRRSMFALAIGPKLATLSSRFLRLGDLVMGCVLLPNIHRRLLRTGVRVQFVVDLDVGEKAQTHVL